MRQCMKLLSPPSWSAPDVTHVETYDISVITPMFGGGYQPGDVDKECVIRPASVRGHLRFWWRATAGAQYETSDELFQAEEDLWGSDRKFGRVAISVKANGKSDPKWCSEIATPRPSAALGPQHGCFIWPFQAQKNTPERQCYTGVSFALTTRYPSEAKSQVDQALTAWLWFGGIGARTRRGCGALDCAAHRMTATPHIDVPVVEHPVYTTLGGAHLVIGDKMDGNGEDRYLRAWKQLGTFWARFRKAHVIGNDVPMRGSDWPDYRKVLVSIERSKGAVALLKPYLGMPIVYQKFAGAPFTGEVVPDRSGRMASPVILRPVVLKDGTVCPAVLILRCPEPTHVRVGTDGPIRKLELPMNDPVLKQLSATDHLDAVVKSARRLLGCSCMETVIGGEA